MSGTVDATGEGVTGVGIGDLVFGVPDFLGYPSAGASDQAILAVWVPVPAGLELNTTDTRAMSGWMFAVRSFIIG